MLALIRIILAFLLFFFLTERDFNLHPSWFDYFAGLTFVLASITDFFDGFIAREWNQKTILGAILDPFADKILMLSAFLGLMLLNRANHWVIFIILAREFFITTLRIVAATNKKNIKASFLGKIKTVSQMFAIGFLIMNWPFGTELLYLSLFFTIISAVEYFKKFF